MTLTSSIELAEARVDALDWALVDVETSGLRPGLHRVLSIAVITLDSQGRQTGEFSTLLDPGCDPGPVHIHGLSRERLCGAPTFEQVADRIGAMLDGRVMVAHNAQFDYDFLTHEFARSRSWLPVSKRLCTLALNRQIGSPTVNLRLGTLAAHYGVPQGRAHDALEDTRTLAGVLRASLEAAARLGTPLPLVTCPPRQVTQFRPRVPKTHCAFSNPGRMPAGGPLTQGMKVALTGETVTAREELTARAVAAGLNFMTSVSRHTSALVTNDPDSGSAKARAAAKLNVPVIDERTFLRLLADVHPGTPHTPALLPAPATEQPQDEGSSHPVTTTEDPPYRPLAERRVLVVGGSHSQAAAARTRVVELGAAAAVNLSASVTDVVVLRWAETDRRMRRIVSLGLPVHDADWLDSPSPESLVLGHGRRPAARILPRGGVMDFPTTAQAAPWTITASWAQQSGCEIDLVAFAVDEDEQVSCDENFVFYGAAEDPDGAMRLSADAPNEQTITLDLAAFPTATRKAVIAAAIDGPAMFGDVGGVEVTASRGKSEVPIAQATLDAATTERTLLLAEVYRRGAAWRFRAVGQGYDHGLDDLARDYGVDIAD